MNTTSRSPRYLVLRIALVSMLAGMAIAATARAQSEESVGNQYVRASASTFESSGRFWITAGPALGSYRFLFGNLFVATSNLIFRVTNGATSTYYSNIPFSFPYRPHLPSGEEVDFKPYDSLYRSADTIAIGWNGMSGFNVVMRLIPEKPGSPFDNGADVLVEFSYTQSPGTPGARLGIMMMLDTYNSQAGGIEGATTITTDHEYFPIGGGGRLLVAGRDSMPEFYHVGNIRYEEPLNTVLGVHRLSGRSHGGRALTAPDMLAVGEWSDMLRDVLWDVDTAKLRTTPISDCATLLRWGGLQGGGTLRTAFGSTDRGGNNFFHCRDSSIFIVMRTSARLLARDDSTGAFTGLPLMVDAWVTSLVDTAIGTCALELEDPNSMEGLAIDGTLPRLQTTSLAPHQVRHFQWRLLKSVGVEAVHTDVPLTVRAAIGDDSLRALLDVCAPIVSIRIAAQPHEDSLPPVITRLSPGADSVHLRRFSAADRHSGYAYDTGIDTVYPRSGGTFNMRLNIQPYTPCDTAAALIMRAEVIDTNQPGHLLMVVYDCRGNTSVDSFNYVPPPRDTMPPALVRTDSTVLRWTLRAADLHDGYRFDTGIDTILVDAATRKNMQVLVAPYEHCDTTAVVTITVRVIDAQGDGFAAFTVFDCRGNAVRDSFSYKAPPAGVETGERGAAGGMAITDLAPVPVVAGAAVELGLRGIGASGADAELIAPDGRVLLAWHVPAGSDRQRLVLPGDLSSGVYLIRIGAMNGSAARKFVVVR